MSAWPALPYEEWKYTYTTLHLWLQVVGKVRLAQSPWVNHQWHVTLYVTPRGLTTSPIPHGMRTFEIAFDFIDHALWIHASDGRSRTLRLEPQTVQRFHRRVLRLLDDLELPVTITRKPNEIVNAIPFDEDTVHDTYEPEHAAGFWQALVQADRVFKQFRARFSGKCSPVHLFWGGCDLAVTRFTGRRAPEHSGGAPNMPDRVLREAYSHECSSAGFWPGDDNTPYPVFFSYAWPPPPGFAQAAVRPAAASYSARLNEFVLPYDAVRESSDPDATLLDFLQSTYEAAAGAGGWDRNALERKLPH